jgi:hypothetical protein
VIDRRPVASSGRFEAAQAEITTYRLVGPQFFLFFAAMMGATGIAWILVAVLYKERTYVREAEDADTTPGPA